MPETSAAPAEKPAASIEERIAAIRQPETAGLLKAEESAPEQPAEEARETPEKAGEGEQAAEPATETPEGDETPSEASAGEAEEGEPVELSTLNELAEHLGVDMSDLYNLSFPITEGSTRRDVTLGEIKDSVQAAREIDRQRNEIAQAREAFEREQQAGREQYEQAVRQARALAEAAEKQLQAERESPRLRELYESDPVEWVRLDRELEKRAQQIEDTKRGIEREHAQAMQQQQQAWREQQEQILAREREALLTARPTWRDEGVAKTEMSALRSYLSSSGFTDAEIDAAADHRVVVMALKAKAYDEQVAATEVAKKRVVRIGRKVVRPGSPRGKTTAREDRVAATKATVRKTGNVNDAAAAISALRRG